MGSSSSAATNGKSLDNDKNKPKDDRVKNEEFDDELNEDGSDRSENDDSDGGERDKDRERKRNRGRQAKLRDDKREELHRDLKSIAHNMIKHPPDRVPNSESYRTSFNEYQQVLNVPNKEVLSKVFDKELWALREHTVSEVSTAEKSNAKNTQEALIAEYKLKLCALINSYKMIKSKIEDERMRLELEKLEDMKFLSKMHDRVENGEMTRAQLVVHMDRYGNEFRAKQNRYNDSSSYYSDSRSTISRRHDYNSSKLGMSASDRRGRTPASIGMNMTDDDK